MPKANSAIEMVRSLCLELPGTKETLTWGKPHFRVADKIFAGCGEENGKLTVGLKLEMDHAARLIKTDPRFSRAPYVGHKGWVSIDANQMTSERELRPLIAESYRLIAPKRLQAEEAREQTTKQGRATRKLTKKKRKRVAR